MSTDSNPRITKRRIKKSISSNSSVQDIKFLKRSQHEISLRTSQDEPVNISLPKVKLKKKKKQSKDVELVKQENAMKQVGIKLRNLSKDGITVVNKSVSSGILQVRARS